MPGGVAIPAVLRSPPRGLCPIRGVFRRGGAPPSPGRVPSCVGPARRSRPFFVAPTLHVQGNDAESFARSLRSFSRGSSLRGAWRGPSRSRPPGSRGAMAAGMPTRAGLPTAALPTMPRPGPTAPLLRPPHRRWRRPSGFRCPLRRFRYPHCRLPRIDATPPVGLLRSPRAQGHGARHCRPLRLGMSAQAAGSCAGRRHAMLEPRRLQHGRELWGDPTLRLRGRSLRGDAFADPPLSAARLCARRRDVKPGRRSAHQVWASSRVSGASAVSDSASAASPSSSSSSPSVPSRCRRRYSGA